jgi:CBS domain-containing protein
MRVHDIMTRSVEIIAPDATLRDAATRMKDFDLGVLPVCDGKRLVGILTDRDITIRAAAEGRDPNVVEASEVMSQQVFHCFEDDLVADAARIMEEKQVRRLVVVSRDDELVGMISLGDIALNTGDRSLSAHTLERVSEPALAAVEIGPDEEMDEDPPYMDFATRTVAGVFDQGNEVQRALGDLRGAGIDPHRVSVITRDASRARGIVSDTGAQVASGTARGAGFGLLLGGVAGWLIGNGAVSIPVVGPIVAAGPLAVAMGVAGTTAAAGAGAGAVAGGLIGALTAWGFSEAEVREYESRVRDGAVIVAAEIDAGSAPRAEAILRDDGADHVVTKKAA